MILLAICDGTPGYGTTRFCKARSWHGCPDIRKDGVVALFNMGALTVKIIIDVRGKGHCACASFGAGRQVAKLERRLQVHARNYLGLTCP